MKHQITDHFLYLNITARVTCTSIPSVRVHFFLPSKSNRHMFQVPIPVLAGYPISIITVTIVPPQGRQRRPVGLTQFSWEKPCNLYLVHSASTHGPLVQTDNALKQCSSWPGFWVISMASASQSYQKAPTCQTFHLPRADEAHILATWWSCQAQPLLAQAFKNLLSSSTFLSG